MLELIGRAMKRPDRSLNMDCSDNVRPSLELTYEVEKEIRDFLATLYLEQQFHATPLSQKRLATENQLLTMRPVREGQERMSNYVWR